MKSIKGSYFAKEKYRYLAAKASSNNMWLPFWAHSLDTAGIIEKLINFWLPIKLKIYFMEKNSRIDLDKLCVFIALVHDIGKIIPVFQSKICFGRQNIN